MSPWKGLKLAKNVTFEPDFKGYQQVLNSAEMRKLLMKNAAMIRARANRGAPGHVMFRWMTNTGAAGYGVRTGSQESKRSQAENKTLTKAFNAQKW